MTLPAAGRAARLPSEAREVPWRLRTASTRGCAISPFLRFVRVAATVLVFAVITGASIWFALQVTPLQTVSAAGQTAQVGAAVPSLSLSGPGELDLFGQVIATKPTFAGPIRPLLQLTHVTIDPRVAQLLRSDGPRRIELDLSQQLARAWTRYFE